MTAASNYLEDAILNLLFDGGSLASPTVYMELHTADPGETGTNSPVANSNGYARTAIGACTVSGTAPTKAVNDANIVFPTASGGNWGTISHISLWDSGTYGGGNCLFYGALGSSVVVNNGNTFTVLAGDLEITLD